MLLASTTFSTAMLDWRSSPTHSHPHLMHPLPPHTCLHIPHTLTPSPSLRHYLLSHSPHHIRTSSHLPSLYLCYLTPSPPPTLTSSHLHLTTPSPIHILTSSLSHPHLLTHTFSHPHLFTPIPQTFTSSHPHLLKSSPPHTHTSSNLHLLTPSPLHNLLTPSSSHTLTFSHCCNLTDLPTVYSHPFPLPRLCSALWTRCLATATSEFWHCLTMKRCLSHPLALPSLSPTCLLSLSLSLSGRLGERTGSSVLHLGVLPQEIDRWSHRCVYTSIQCK